MNATKATVLVGMGADIVMLTTDLPSSFVCYPNEKLHLKFEATNGAGADYVRENFQIEPEIIEMS